MSYSLTEHFIFKKECKHADSKTRNIYTPPKTYFKLTTSLMGAEMNLRFWVPVCLLESSENLCPVSVRTTNTMVTKVLISKISLFITYILNYIYFNGFLSKVYYKCPQTQNPFPKGHLF